MQAVLFQALLFVFCFLPDNSLRGIVRDPSGSIVAGACVEAIANGTTLIRYTDGLGQFDFGEVAPGSYLLRISAPSFERYESWISIPSDPLAVRLSLAPDAQNVVVTATRTEMPVALIGASISVIDAENIRQQQASTVLEVLRDVPGLMVSNTSRRGGTTAVHTRGASRNASLVLIDGIRINDPGGDFNFAHLTTANVEKIEVVRGPRARCMAPTQRHPSFRCLHAGPRRRTASFPDRHPLKLARSKPSVQRPEFPALSVRWIIPLPQSVWKRTAHFQTMPIEIWSSPEISDTGLVWTRICGSRSVQRTAALAFPIELASRSLTVTLIGRRRQS